MKNIFQTGMMAAGIGLLLVGGTVSVAAQGNKEAEIKARQAFMKAQGGDVKTISEYAKGQGSEAAALKAAENLVARAPKILSLFPAGTSAADFPGKTRAKPEIWTDFEKFKTIPEKLAAEEAKLVAAIKSGDRRAVANQLGATGRNGCNACHGTYRMKRS